MKTQILAVLTIISVGIIAGCGGGSSTPATSISGKVADGYLVGATVFMDKSNPPNYQQDPGEPSATTDANGAYTLMNVDPADVGKYPIVAMAIKGVTKDRDTNTFVNNSYILSMPATDLSGTANSSNFISPMSTQVRELMGTGKTMQQAMDQLNAKLGLPVGTNMLADYMVNPNSPNNANYQNYTVMHTAAQNMAGLMGSQMIQVLTTGSTTTVDVNRYRGMMGAIFSNMSSIRGSNAQPAMSNLNTTMPTYIQNITSGQPFRNMSVAFRGSMMR
jgi:hypothetical protein